jgi:hypothetical protein
MDIVKTESTRKARWAVGALYYNNQKNALPGEIVVDHEAGVLGVKSYEGEVGSTERVVSFEYLNRVKTTCSKFKRLILDDGYEDGDVFKIDIGEYVGPAVLKNDTGYNLHELTLSEKRLSYIRFYFDIEVINLNSGLSIPIIPELELEIEIAQHSTNEDITKTIEFTKQAYSNINITNFYNKTGLNYSDFLSGTHSQKSHLNYFKFTLPENYAETHKIVLYGLFVAFLEVN